MSQMEEERQARKAEMEAAQASLDSLQEDLERAKVCVHVKHLILILWVAGTNTGCPTHQR